MQKWVKDFNNLLVIIILSDKVIRLAFYVPFIFIISTFQFNKHIQLKSKTTYYSIDSHSNQNI